MHTFPFLPSGRLQPIVALSGGGGVTVDVDGSVLLWFAAFLIFFVAIKPVLLDPFLAVVEEREKRTDGAKSDARRMDEKAGDIFKRYETELEKVRRVANEERERIRAEAQKLEAQILAEARQESTQVVDAGKRKIREEADGIRFQLGQAAASLSHDIASQVLGREVR